MNESLTTETANESTQVMDTPPPKKKGWPKGKKRGPRKARLPDPAIGEPTSGRPRTAEKPDLSSGEWVDHGAVHIQIIESEIPWALEHMFGIPRGLVRKDFKDRAKAVLNKRYPRLRKSAIHIASEMEDSFFVALPDWAKKNFDRTIRLCDLIETVVFDGGFGQQDNPIT